MAVGISLRGGALQARAMTRMLGVWPWVALMLWPVLIKLQEPDFFRRDGVPFYWASLQAAFLITAGALPLALRFAQGELHAWDQQVGRSCLTPCLTSWLGAVFYGALLLLPLPLWCYSVERIITPSAASLEMCLDTMATTLAFLVMFASLGGLLSQLRGSIVTVVFAWSVLLILGLQLFPFGEASVDFSASERKSGRFLGILSTLCATLGGLAFSLAHGFHRHRRP